MKTFKEQTKKSHLFDFWARKEQKVTVAEEILIPLTIRTRLTPAYWWDCSGGSQYSYCGWDHRACCHFYLTVLMEGWESRMREPLTQVMGLVCSSLQTNWRWCGLPCWLTLLSLWRQDDQELWIKQVTNLSIKCSNNTLSKAGLPHTSQFFVAELQIFCRDISLLHTSRFFAATNRV